MRRNPFDDLEDVLDRIGCRVEEGMTRGTGFPVPGEVAVDVRDVGSEYVVAADLPGYETDDIDLTFSEGTLRLEAGREDPGEHEAGRYIRRERPRRSTSRRLRLPEPIDEEGVSASYDRGVLTVRLPKEFDDEAKRIDID